MTWKEKKMISKQVSEKYPISKAEMKCRSEKKIMDRLRDVYRRKLEGEFVVSKREY
jgi:hypothetical protein